MGAVASRITSLMIVYSTVYPGADQIKHESSASLAFVRGIYRWPVNSPYTGPVTRKMFPFDDDIMFCLYGFILFNSSMNLTNNRAPRWRHYTEILNFIALCESKLSGDYPRKVWSGASPMRRHRNENANRKRVAYGCQNSSSSFGPYLTSCAGICKVGLQNLLGVRIRCGLY